MRDNICHCSREFVSTSEVSVSEIQLVPLFQKVQ